MYSYSRSTHRCHPTQPAMHFICATVPLTDVVCGREAAVSDAPVGVEPDVELVGGGGERRRHRLAPAVAPHQGTVRVRTVPDLRCADTMSLGVAW